MTRSRTMNNVEGERIVPMRLQRFLARAGVASRRGSERLMTEGRVRVNGVVVSELGSKVDPIRDTVEVDGHIVGIADAPVYLMLNKPEGYLTTMSDPQGRPTIKTMVPTKRYPGLFPVGRLDMDTSGLLLFTTDGTMAQELLHPSRHVWKHYLALVLGVPTEAELERLRSGVMLDDGMAQPAKVELRDDLMELHGTPRYPQNPNKPQNAIVGIWIHEGRKHQVKKMMSAIGHRVLVLHRDAFGPLRLTDVEEGCWRELRDEEIAALREQTSADKEDADE